MIYNKLFQDYVNPARKQKDSYISISDSRLRWLKYEAFGNSKFKSTSFGIRHAHICNRNLQQQLGVNLAFYANNHGKTCNEIEIKQEKLWAERVYRNQKLKLQEKLAALKKKNKPKENPINKQEKLPPILDMSMQDLFPNIPNINRVEKLPKISNNKASKVVVQTDNRKEQENSTSISQQERKLKKENRKLIKNLHRKDKTKVDITDIKKPFSTVDQYSVYNYSERKVVVNGKGSVKNQYGGKTDFLKYDRKKKTEVRILNTEQDSSLRSQHLVYNDIEELS